MNEYCTLVTPDTLRIERELPGPIERVWAFLTESDKRKTWMGAGDIEMRVGGEVEHVFRNAELTGQPDGLVDEYRTGGTVLACDPPRLLSYTWDGGSDVTFELTPAGDRVQLVVTHRRIADRDSLVSYSAGWHSHLNLLSDRLAGHTPASFDEVMSAFEAEYAQRIPG